MKFKKLGGEKEKNGFWIGRRGGGYRWRNMYYLTGLPGWMRFGFSPDWIERSQTGLPPTAQYLMQTGQITAPSGFGFGAPVMTKDQKRQMLENQAKALEQQIEQIKKRIEELR